MEPQERLFNEKSYAEHEPHSLDLGRAMRAAPVRAFRIASAIGAFTNGAAGVVFAPQAERCEQDQRAVASRARGRLEPRWGAPSPASARHSERHAAALLHSREAGGCRERELARASRGGSSRRKERRRRRPARRRVARDRAGLRGDGRARREKIVADNTAARNERLQASRGG